MDWKTTRFNSPLRHFLCGWAACLFLLLGCTGYGIAQETNTYTLDTVFDTGELFRHIYGVKDVLEDEQGRYLAVGKFDPVSGPFRFSGRVLEDGSADLSWNSQLFGSGYWQVEPFFENRYLIINLGGEYLDDFTDTGELIYTTPNDMPVIDFHLTYSFIENYPLYPYKVTNFEVLPNNEVLICGKFLVEISEPNRRQHLIKVHPDGSNDLSFPLVECEPNSENVYSNRVLQAANGKWYLSGYFQGVNGHYSPNIVRLNPDFSVDTTFTSPFISPFNQEVGGARVEFVDADGRVWVSGKGARTVDLPGEPVYLCRLMPNGTLDSSFSIPTLSINPALTAENDTEEAHIAGIAPLNGQYLVYGEFATYNETGRKCIAMIDESGQLAEGYFEELGADSCRYFNQVRHPRIGDVLIEDDGTLVVGGAFSSFGGEEHYNMVKLQPESVGFEDIQGNESIKVYPNPAEEMVYLSWPKGLNPQKLTVIDSRGKIVDERRVSGSGNSLELDTQNLRPGIYFLYITSTKSSHSPVKLIVL